MNIILDKLKSLPYANVPPETVQYFLTLPREKTLEELRNIALSDNDILAGRAIYAILDIDADYGRKTLIEMHGNEKWWQFIAYSAYRYGDSSFIEPLCEILSTSKNPNNRVLAAGALVNLGDATAVPTLISALDDEGEDYEGRKVKVYAQKALDRINSNT